MAIFWKVLYMPAEREREHVRSRGAEAYGRLSRLFFAPVLRKASSFRRIKALLLVVMETPPLSIFCLTLRMMA